MNHHDTLRRLDALIESRSILNHPFYVAWQRGELTRQQLGTYATTYYPHVASFPRYVKSAADSTGDALVRLELERNLADELSRPKSHHELWLDFAEGLGLDRTAVAHAEPRPAAAQIVHTFDRLSRGEAVEALAALYAYESQQPEVSRQKAEGLRRFYGVDGSETLAYFDVHAQTDVDHRNGEREALSRCLAMGASPEAMLASAEEALGAYWRLLDGICLDAAVAMTR